MLLRIQSIITKNLFKKYKTMNEKYQEIVENAQKIYTDLKIEQYRHKISQFENLSKDFKLDNVDATFSIKISNNTQKN